MESGKNKLNEIRTRLKEGKCTDDDLNELEKLLSNIEDSVKKIRTAVIAGW
jgi:hypothetical protein